MPQSELNELLRTEGVAYAPTSLERGTRHFHLPAELLKLPVFNLVDLEAFRTKSSNSATSNVDKDFFLSIEDLERKFNISEVKESSHSSTSTSNSAPSPFVNSTTNYLPSSSKFVRPDVTWLRRTEYISSVKNNPNSSALASDDAAKVFLADPVDFAQIVAQVDASFDRVKDKKHPFKSNLELIQSFPLHHLDLDNYSHENQHNLNNYSHCLFLGDNSANDRSILQLSADGVNLFNPSSSSSVGNHQEFVLHGDFDIQKIDTGKTKSFVIMLPVDSQNNNRAQLAKIGSSFSLRKRRATSKSKSSPRKLKKVIKVNRSLQ